jgi:hypothetical protein
MDAYLQKLVYRSMDQEERPAPTPNDHGVVSVAVPDGHVAEEEEQKGKKDKTSVGQFFEGLKDSPTNAMKKSAQERIDREKSMEE